MPSMSVSFGPTGRGEVTNLGPQHKEPSMTDDSEDRPYIVSRRELIKRVGFASAAAAVPVDVLAQVSALPRGPLETLTEAEANTLDAIVARLIPTDANGPGATRGPCGALHRSRARRRARAVTRRLPGWTRRARCATRARRRARRSRNSRRRIRTPCCATWRRTPRPASAERGDLLQPRAGRTRFRARSAIPYYGGNANFVGWDLIGYPGVRLAVRADRAASRRTRRPRRTMSAYDYAMFSKKKPARARADAEEPHHAG